MTLATRTCHARLQAAFSAEASDAAACSCDPVLTRYRPCPDAMDRDGQP